MNGLFSYIVVYSKKQFYFPIIFSIGIHNLLEREKIFRLKISIKAKLNINKKRIMARG